MSWLTLFPQWTPEPPSQTTPPTLPLRKAEPHWVGSHREQGWEDMKWSWSFRGWLFLEASINASVGLQRMKGYFVCLVKVKSESRTFSRVPLFVTPMDCSPPGSSVHGVSQARILEWGCHFLLQGISLTQGLNPGLLHCRQILYHLSYQGSPLFALTLFKRMLAWATGQTKATHKQRRLRQGAELLSWAACPAFMPGRCGHHASTGSVHSQCSVGTGWTNTKSGRLRKRFKK